MINGTDIIIGMFLMVIIIVAHTISSSMQKDCMRVRVCHKHKKTPSFVTVFFKR